MSKNGSQTAENIIDYHEWCKEGLEKIDSHHLKEVYQTISYYEKRSTKKIEQKEKTEQENWITRINIYLEDMDCSALRKIFLFVSGAWKVTREGKENE